jgi:NADH dehydrogenase FAD-containing subunit
MNEHDVLVVGGGAAGMTEVTGFGGTLIDGPRATVFVGPRSSSQPHS